MPFAAMQTDLKIFILNEVGQTKTNTVWYHLYVESKIWYKWTYVQNRNRPTDTENKLMVTKEERGGGGVNKEVGVNIYTLVYIK